jgi:outer membrane protein TolC
MQALFTADQAISEQVADALVVVGVEEAPELAELDARIAVQQRTHAVARRAWGMPTIAAAATVAGIGRAGYDPFSLPGLPPRTFPEQPSGIWTVGAQASLPLFTGGARDADRREAAALLSALEHERRFAAEGIEQRVRDSLTAAAGSYASRQLASVAEAAALRNAEWATQAYAQGSLPQVGLIDARGAALDASLGTADASFVLAIDLLHLQRAVLHQQAVLDDTEWAAFVADVVALLEAP